MCLCAALPVRSVVPNSRISPDRFMIPSRINISPTENSIDSPIRGGITHPKRMIPPPTTRIVKVWPSPHAAPMAVALERVFSRATIVVTAIT